MSVSRLHSAPSSPPRCAGVKRRRRVASEATAIILFMPIAIFDSATIPRERRAELEAAVVAAGKQLSKRFEGWIVAAPDRREFAVRITSYPEADISVPFAWNATAAEVTERVRAAMED
jgi:hypothetical protein